MPVPQSGHEYVDFPTPLIPTLLCAGSLAHLVDIYSKRSSEKLMSLNIWIPLSFVGVCVCFSINRGLCEEGSCQLKISFQKLGKRTTVPRSSTYSRVWPRDLYSKRALNLRLFLSEFC